MKAWPRPPVLWAGLVLLLATNAIVLGGAVYNRSGEPEAMLRFSQRELELPYRSGFERENSGVSLRIDWRVPRSPKRDDSLYDYAQDASWLDQTKLAELGFDVSRASHTVEGQRFYAKQLPREVFLVLEFDGPAYRAALQRAESRAQRAAQRAAGNPGVVELQRSLESANRDLESERQRASRLFVVDAGRDSSRLRQRYADRSRYAIVPGIVRLTTYRRGMDTVPAGYVEGLSVATVNVPAAHRAPFASAYKGADEAVPRVGNYEASVAFGRRLEPWIVGIRRGGS